MASRNTIDNLGFLDALFGLVTQPAETTEVLFEAGRPRFILSFLLLFAIMLFGPMAYLSYRYNVAAYSPDHLYSLGLVAFFTLFAFVLLEGIMLLLFGVTPSIRDLFACAAYSLAPLSAALFLLYAFNYFTAGDLSMTRALFGMDMADGNFARILPYAIFIISLDMALVLVFSLRAMGDMHVLSAMCVAVMSAVPFYVALLAGVILAELALPGTRKIVVSMLSAYT